jgi:hypothetical protein
VRRADIVLALSIVPALSSVGAPLAGQEEFIVSVRAATARYRDQAAAIADGYRRIGPDFPSMGEHWLSIPIVVRGEVDPLHPPILEYVTVNGEPVLAGVAYTHLVRGGPPLTLLPAPPGAWHFHEGTVDEESFILSHANPSAAVPADSGHPRIGVLHAWLWLENPAGLFATDNWALPWHRLGIPPPKWVGAFSPAGLAAALASGGVAYFVTLLRLRHHLTIEQSNKIAEVLERHAHALRVLLQAGNAGREPRLEAELAGAWSAAEADLRSICSSCSLSKSEHQH